MSIDTKNWLARINKMPSLEGPKLLVSGTVTVPNSATEVTLVESKLQDKSYAMNLDLVLKNDGIGATVMTEKTVSFSMPTNVDVPSVTIFHNGEKLVRIDSVEIVH